MKRSAVTQLFIIALSAVVLSATSLAFALPTPKDIETAVNSGKLHQAEVMLKEVIDAKPQSAKAQYELGQVLAQEARYAEAQIALKKAKEIDPSLKFTSDVQKFNETQEFVTRKLNGETTSQHTNATASVAPTTTQTSTENHFPLSYIWAGIGCLALLALFLRRQATTQANAPSVNNPITSAYGAPQTYPPSSYPAQQPMGTGIGSGIGGAVVGGLAGVAAGYAISKALEGDHHTSSGSASQDNAYIPLESNSQAGLGGFDSGSGNDWDDSLSVDTSDDSW
jgi:hypothetical protein